MSLGSGQTVLILYTCSEASNDIICCWNLSISDVNEVKTGCTALDNVPALAVTWTLHVLVQQSQEMSVAV